MSEEQNNNGDKFDLKNIGREAFLNIGRYAKTIYINITSSWFFTSLTLLVVIALLLLLIFFMNKPISQGQMEGEWNVAVMGFQNAKNIGISKEEANVIGNVFYNRLEDELSSLGEEINIEIEIWDPERTGIIEGDTPEERAESASKEADKINADIIIYGAIVEYGNGYRLQPEFFVAIDNFYEAEEMVGQHALGGEISLIGSGDDLPSQISMNRELSNRAQILALMTRGLSYYSVHDYEGALFVFKEANENELWSSNNGREVLYLFIGNAAAKALLSDEADEAYSQALEIEPEYSRAFAGLGSAKYLLAIDGISAENFSPNQELLDISIELFNNALEAEIQPPTADIPSKVSFGLGQAYLVKWFMGEDTLDLAVRNFESVVTTYNETENSRIKEFVSESNARLGLINRQLENTSEAISYFEDAVNLTTAPSRKGLYWATLADLYSQIGETGKSDDANRFAIDQYELAIGLTLQTELKADYWHQISMRYAALGEYENAVMAIENAIVFAADPKELESYRSTLLENLE